MARDNSYYGIPSRTFVPHTSKAKELTHDTLNRIKDPLVRYSLQLQRLFGLRREEAIKFKPSYADRGDHLQLKSTWTKGGRARIIPIRHQAQRDLLDKIREVVGSESLIPSHLRYVDQLHIYERQVAQGGFQGPMDYAMPMLRNAI